MEAERLAGGLRRLEQRSRRAGDDAHHRIGVADLRSVRLWPGHLEGELDAPRAIDVGARPIVVAIEDEFSYQFLAPRIVVPNERPPWKGFGPVR